MEKDFLYNLRWQTPKGYAASLTVQADDVDDLVSKVKVAMEKLGATSNGNGHSANGSANEQSGHYCQEHQTEFKRYEKEGRVWYAHKAGSNWCREKV